MNERRHFFSDVYKNNLWDSKESASGQGSEVWVCQNIIQQLPSLVARHNIRSLLDVPCGDLNWMQHVPLQSVRYIGGDIVPDLIEQNGRKFAQSTKEFQLIDIVDEPIPAVDLIFIRDLFIHFSLDLIRKTLNNIASSSCRFVMMTHDALDSRYPPEGNIELSRAKNGVNYEFRCLNMTKAPFFLPPPLEMIHEDQALWDGYKTMALWSREQLVQSGFGASPDIVGA